MSRKTISLVLLLCSIFTLEAALITTQTTTTAASNDQTSQLRIAELFDLVADIYLDYEEAHQNPTDNNIDSLLEQLQLSQNQVQRIFDEVEVQFELAKWAKLSQRFAWIKVKAQTFAVFEVIRAAHKDVDSYRNNDFSSFTERSYRGEFSDISKQVEKAVQPFDLYNDEKWKQFVAGLEKKLSQGEAKNVSLVSDVQSKIKELHSADQACEKVRQVVEKDARDKHQFLNVKQQHELNFAVDYAKQGVATLEKLIDWLQHSN